MSSPGPISDAWLSTEEYSARAAVNVELRAEATAWMAGMVGWFAANQLHTHKSLPVLHGVHWAKGGREIWLLATPTDHRGTPATFPPDPGSNVRRLRMCWVPCPVAPPARLRPLATPLPVGSSVPGIRPTETDMNLVRAASWKAGIARVNRELEERKDWWEHRSLGIDAQRARNTGAGTWYDRVRAAVEGG